MESPALPRPHRWGGYPCYPACSLPAAPVKQPYYTAKMLKIKAFLARKSITPAKLETKSGESKGYFGNWCIGAGIDSLDNRTIMAQ